MFSKFPSVSDILLGLGLLYSAAKVFYIE